MQISGRPVKVISNSEISVGEISVSRNQLEKALRLMNECPKNLVDPNISYESNIENVRDMRGVSGGFMEPCCSGKFKGQGFFLGSITGKKWKIVIDDAGSQILVMEN